MAKSHESKLFVVDVMYDKAIRTFVFRTRAAARKFAATKKAQKNVFGAYITPATWGPDA